MGASWGKGEFRPMCFRSAVGADVIELDVVANSNVVPVGFSSVYLKGIGGAGVGTVPGYPLVGSVGKGNADVGVDVHHAAISSYPDEVQGELHALHPQLAYLRSVGNVKHALAGLEVRAACEALFPEMLGAGNLNVKPDFLKNDPGRTVVGRACFAADAGGGEE